MNKKEESDNLLVIEGLLQIRALQSLLINKGLITKHELDSQLKLIMSHVSKDILLKANVSEKEIEKFISQFDNK